jgi:hypothetical protein
MLIWHMPTGLNQNVMVVMAWRQQVMRLGRADATKTSTGGAQNETSAQEVDEEEEERLKDQKSAKTKHLFKPGQKNADQMMKDAAKMAKSLNDAASVASRSLDKKFEDKTAEEIESELGIVVEVARCDLEAAQLQHFVGAYLEAVHSKPQPKRQSHMTEALRVLSGNLGIGELLTMAPVTTTSIIICCPPLLRLVPWHLLLIDAKEDSISKELQESYVKPVGGTDPQPIKKERRPRTDGSRSPTNDNFDLNSLTTGGSLAGLSAGNKGSAARVPGFGDERLVCIHLIEKYLVRLGPTLSLWETSCNTAMRFSQSIGLHRLVAINGESLDKASLGIRSSSTEISCVTSTFSGDPEDYKVFSGQSAIPGRLRTMFAGSAHLARPVVVADRKTDDDAMMELGRLKAEKKMRKDQKIKEKEKKKEKKAEEIRAQVEKGRHVLDHSSSEESSEVSSSDSEEEDKLLQTIRLSTCRILHISAPKASGPSAVQQST